MSTVAYTNNRNRKQEGKNYCQENLRPTGNGQLLLNKQFNHWNKQVLRAW